MEAVSVLTRSSLRSKAWECSWPAGVVLLTGVLLQVAGWEALGPMALMAGGLLLLTLAAEVFKTWRSHRSAGSPGAPRDPSD